MATEIPSGNQGRDIERDLSTSAREGLRGLIDRGGERAGHYKDAAMDRGRSAVSSMRGQIDTHPFVVIGGVFVVGVALGMLLRRR